MTQIVSLIGARGTNAVTVELIDSLKNAWGGADVKWLAAGEASEFAVVESPGNRWEVWSDLQTLGVDLIVQPEEGRRKKMLLADMDSTMIQQECIDELAAEAGVGDRVAAITAAAMNGELDFDGALSERVGLLKGLPESVINEVLDKRITLMPGGSELIATMKVNGAYAALVSGGFTAFTGAIAEKLGFDENRANTLEIENGILTGSVVRPILGRDAKVQTLNDVAKAQGKSPQDVLAVGDGANDLGMLALAGTGVALHAKPAVAAQCDIRINHGDLTALLYLQGYAKAEFAPAPT